ncbi:MAG: PIN domain-containing protein [Armatimonadetes bacterium]|nr:PIN domain-containing protein [Armatimonadota bacterium]MDE2205057.1 PIN domain-containing protein [Armatimonadota bacterium]
MAFVGLFAGFWVGPRAADLLMTLGRNLERMKPADKIAVAVGVCIGAVITLLFYQFLSNMATQLKVPVAIQIAFQFVLLVAMVYLGVVAMLSMRAEVAAMLARGQGGNQTESGPQANCKILDTNVIIDGRIADVCRAGFVEGTLYVPGFVLEELQHIADSPDSLKRARGRRGLDILNGMREQLPMVVRTWDKALERSASGDTVDTKLVKLAKALEGAIITNDFNLNKVALLQGVTVLNVNELANALKPAVLPGEIMQVKVVKEGKEAEQGLAYLDDGTMIVVEDGRRVIGATVEVVVASVIQTAAGKMIFAKLPTEDDTDYSHGRQRATAEHPEEQNVTSFTNHGSTSGRGTGKAVR